MKFCLLMSLVFMGLGLLYPNELFAERVGLREKLKQRWAQKQKDKPAPEVSPIVGELSEAGTYTFSLSVGGVPRYYMIHLPSQYNKSEPAPLMVAMHGGGGSMLVQSRDKIYGLISKSNKEGFVVVFPNGYSALPSGAFATWNAGECCAEAHKKNSDDVGFIKMMLEDLKSKIRFKEDQVFAIGMSNGGMMAYRLACEAPELFKGIASVTGTDNTVTCSPERAISILHIHALDDPNVLYNGGKGEGAFKGKFEPIAFKPVTEAINKWRERYSCSPTPKRILSQDKAYCDLYEGCKDGAKVQLCITEDGGHSWPGTDGIPIGKGKPSQAIVANDVIWDFFTK